MKLRILDDNDKIWLWDGTRIVFEGDDTENGGYAAASFNDVVILLLEGLYMENPRIEDFSHKLIIRCSECGNLATRILAAYEPYDKYDREEVAYAHSSNRFFCDEHASNIQRRYFGQIFQLSTDIGVDLDRLRLLTQFMGTLRLLYITDNHVAIFTDLPENKITITRKGRE